VRSTPPREREPQRAVWTEYKAPGAVPGYRNQAVRGPSSLTAYPAGARVFSVDPLLILSPWMAIEFALQPGGAESTVGPAKGLIQVIRKYHLEKPTETHGGEAVPLLDPLRPT